MKTKFALFILLFALNLKAEPFAGTLSPTLPETRIFTGKLIDLDFAFLAGTHLNENESQVILLTLSTFEVFEGSRSLSANLQTINFYTCTLESSKVYTDSKLTEILEEKKLCKLMNSTPLTMTQGASIVDVAYQNQEALAGIVATNTIPRPVAFAFGLIVPTGAVAVTKLGSGVKKLIARRIESKTKTPIDVPHTNFAHKIHVSEGKWVRTLKFSGKFALMLSAAVAAGEYIHFKSVQSARISGARIHSGAETFAFRLDELDLPSSNSETDPKFNWSFISLDHFIQITAFLNLTFEAFLAKMDGAQTPSP